MASSQPEELSKAQSTEHISKPVNREEIENGKSIWLCVYNADKYESFLGRAKVGNREKWKHNGVARSILEKDLRPGDLVVIWRTVKAQDRGGIVGWGNIIDENYVDESFIYFTLTDWFPDNSVPRDKVLESIPTLEPSERPKFPGLRSLRQLTGAEYSTFMKHYASLSMNTSIITQHDAPTTRDELGRRPFAIGLVEQIQTMTREGEANDGFAVHIHAPWGAGKTSFWYLMKEQLERDWKGNPPWVCVEFNAWRYQNRRPPWWPIIQSVLKSLLPRTSYDIVYPKDFLGRTEIFAKYLLGLFVPWKKFRKYKINDTIGRIKIFFHKYWWKLWFEWSPYILGIIAVLSLIIFAEIIAGKNFSGNTFSREGMVHLVDSVIKAADNIKILTVIPTTIIGIFAATRALSFGSKEKAEFHFKMSRDPLDNISRLFKRIMNASNRPVCIFIDDLDRCNPEYVVEILEGIQTSFRHKNVCYIVAADKDWIRTSFKDHFSSMTNDVGNEGQSLGYLFLEKIFQVSSPLPGINSKSRKRYWNNLLGAADTENTYEQPETNSKPTEVSNPDTSEPSFNTQAYNKAIIQIETYGKTLTQDVIQYFLRNDASPEMKAALVYVATIRDQDAEKRVHILSNFATLLPSNPRAMKRILNAFSLRQSIAVVEETPLSLGKLARWTILEQQYPSVTDLLTKRPELIEHFTYTKNIESSNEIPNDVKYLKNIYAVQRILTQEITDENTERIDSKLTVNDIKLIVGIPIQDKKSDDMTSRLA